MSKVVQETNLVKKPKNKADKYRSMKFADAASNWRIKLSQKVVAGRDRKSSWRPRSPLGAYLWHVAKLFEKMDEAADERHIREHLLSSPPLHVRRTLDQYYFWTVEDTTIRDRDQVVCQGTRSSHNPGATARLVMVDQLWLWILDESRFQRFEHPLHRCPSFELVFYTYLSADLKAQTLS